MKNGKKIIIAIIVILILLLISGCAFAYVYISTDIFKSDRQLFAQYFVQIISEDGFVEKSIKEFNEKKTQTPYENSGEITVEVEYPEDVEDKIIDRVNDLSIKFSGKSDVLNQKVEQNIEVDYGNDIIFPVAYRQDNNKFGLQFEELSKQFIAIRNENLDEFAESFDSDEDIASIPQKITSLSELRSQGIEFSEEEKNQLIQTYGGVLLKDLTNESFSSQKTDNSESYTLELNNEQIKNLIIKMLEVSKTNTLIIDKINQLMSEFDSETELIDASMIDNWIQRIKGEETSNNLTNIIDMAEDITEGVTVEDVADIPNLKITLVQSNKKLNQIIFEFGDAKTTITKNETEGSLNYSINFEMIQTTETNSIFAETTSSTQQYGLYFNMQYTGLEDLSNVKENYEITFGSVIDNESMKYNYKINTNTQFKDSVLIESLNEDVAIFLNDHEAEQVSNFISNVGEKLGEINKKQMESLGLKEDENPLLYSNPITMLGYTVYKEASETIEKIDLSELETQAFNGRFIQYEGEKRRGSQINAMIRTIQKNNLQYPDRVVKVTLNGNEVNDSVETSKLYQVEVIYNEKGLITEMRVTTQN